jgi:BlaI family penicillinase repressor
MAATKLSKLEFRIMEALWTNGPLSIREIQEALSGKQIPAYTTIQTTIYRMETKGIVRRARKVGNFHIFDAVISRTEAQRSIIDDLLSYFGGKTQPVMAHLVESGKLSLEDVREAERALTAPAKKGQKR